MQVDNLCNLEIKKGRTCRGRGREPWKPRHSLHLVAEGAMPFLTQESDLMGIVFRKERNRCGRECEGEKSYWGGSHAGVDCIQCWEKWRERNYSRDLEGCDQDLAGRRKRRVGSVRTRRSFQVKTLGG